MMYRHSLILLVATVVFLAMPAISQELTERGVDSDTPVIVPQQMSGAMTWEINIPAEQVFLRVVGSNGEVYSKKFIAPEKPHYGFVDSKGMPLPDGKYGYEIIAPRSLSSSEALALADAAGTAKSAWENAARARRSLTRSEENGPRSSMDEVRRLEAVAIEADRRLEELRDQIRKQNGSFVFKRGGTFTIENGAVAIPDESDRRDQHQDFTANLSSVTPDVGTLDVTDSGDIMAGSGLAAGNTSAGPADGELELWDETPRVSWVDTDSSVTWRLQTVTGDWTLDNANFDVLRIHKDAPSDGLRIDGSGNVGLGTSAPSRELHISSAHPEIRLFDETDSTFSEITYDGGKLIFEGSGAADIFTINAAAPANSLFISALGTIGIGTDSPATPLHIADDIPEIRLEDVDTGGGSWDLTAIGNADPEFHVRDNVNATIPFEIESGAPSGSFHIESDGSINITGGSETNPSLIFGDDADTGFYLDGADVVALSAGGVQRFRVTAAGTNIFDGRLAAQSGSLGFPGFTFIHDSDTGMMNPVQGALGWPVDGTLKMYLNSSGLQVFGNLTKSSGSFKIDHPLDPANKYLYHSFVESPDMMNIYNGNVTLDEEGRATVVLPEWFEALNGDYRYQLTPIGKTDDVLYIEREIEENSFVIAGGEPGTRVSWLVTGVRIDPYAVANRIRVEENKPLAERGTFLFPGYYESQEKTASKESHSPLENDARESGAIHSLELENHELKTKNRELERALQRLTARVAALESMMVGSVPAEAASTD